jgi:hypothetical protein
MPTETADVAMTSSLLVLVVLTSEVGMLDHAQSQNKDQDTPSFTLFPRDGNVTSIVEQSFYCGRRLVSFFCPASF